MRVISGIAKGHGLAAPKGLDTRPTADRIKQSIFNMIAPDLLEARFLDLFAGSGAIGIEALSRGALSCVFVDNAPDAMKVILKNIEHSRFSEKSETYLASAQEALEIIVGKNEPFDIIFMDPPYKDAEFYIKTLTSSIKRLELLTENGYIIGEHGLDVNIGAYENIIPMKMKSYGKTTGISFWRPR